MESMMNTQRMHFASRHVIHMGPAGTYLRIQYRSTVTVLSMFAQEIPARDTFLIELCTHLKMTTQSWTVMSQAV